MKRYRIVIVFLMILAVCSCKKDEDEKFDVEIVDPRPLSEVAIENDAELIEYFSTHFYNYEEFENPPADFDFEIKISPIDENNLDKTAIIDSDRLSFVDLKVSSNTFPGDIPEETDISHRLYFLSARDGGGENPTVVDSVYIQYEGFTLDDNVFENNLTWFDLQGTGTIENSGQFVQGFKEGLVLLKDGNNLIENVDGTFNIDDSGIGVIFMPSGLAYFNSGQVGAAFSPIAFKVDMLEANQADHDRDGIPSILEDLNANLDLFDDNTDETDFPNYLDADDDNDDIPTIDEIELDADGKFVGFKDTDGDGTPDHLDNDN
ncbi:MAG: FKBP-type peptidyl-prolyl cis-trans isomerase [Maribacter sp.]